MEIRDALTFDDILLVPAESAVTPYEAETRTRLTRSIGRYPADLGGDGYGHGIEHGNSDGAGWWHRRASQELDMANRPTKCGR